VSNKGNPILLQPALTVGQTFTTTTSSNDFVSGKNQSQRILSVNSKKEIDGRFAQLQLANNNG